MHIGRICFLGLTLFLNSYQLMAQIKESKIKFELIVEGKKLTTDDVNIYFVSQNANRKTIISPKIDNGSFVFPNLGGDSMMHIIVQYNKEVFSFGTIEQVNQNMIWRFGIDKRPYQRSYLGAKANDPSVQGMVYIEFEPLERGEGTVSSVTITDWKGYQKNSKRIIEPKY